MTFVPTHYGSRPAVPAPLSSRAPDPRPAPLAPRRHSFVARPVFLPAYPKGGLRPRPSVSVGAISYGEED